LGQWCRCSLGQWCTHDLCGWGSDVSMTYLVWGSGVGVVWGSDVSMTCLVGAVV